MARGIKIYGITLIFFGVYNLLGVGDFKSFSIMFKGINHFFVMGIYLFTVFYGISQIYCGPKLLRREEWSRKLIVGVTSISVILGLLLNRIVIRNFREFILSAKADLSPELIDPVFKYAVVFTAIVTLYELSIIYYFTRTDIKAQFKPKTTQEAR